MHSRVKPEYKQAKDYFERGITICARWGSYANFLADMGECPDGLSIDRKNNDGYYEPGNCRWANSGVQRRNSRRVVFVDFNGAQMHVKDAAAHIGVTDSAIYNERKRNGGSIQDAFDRIMRRC